jgi:hypothetical protein
LTAEDRIHLALLLALCAANAAVLTWPASHSPEREQAARVAMAEPATELDRAELDAAIKRVSTWLEGARAAALLGSEQEVALRGLGPTPQDRANPERWFSRWLGPDLARAWLNDKAVAAAPAESRAELSAALVILLEAGVPLSQPLSPPVGEQAAGAKLSDLVQRLLDAEPARTELSSPWQLDLLSLAVLGGMSQYRDRLARATLRELRRLDQEQRTTELRPGDGAPTPQQLEALARAWRADAGSYAPGALDLHWSVAVFRGAAVLNDAALTAAARQHQRALLGRYRNDRALYRHLEATARDERERVRVQLSALENLGRLEEALYGAHLTFSHGAERAPGAETARVMRMAAHDLVEHWQSLEANSLTTRTALPPQQRTALLRAAVHALRGLRTARVAG